MVDTPARYKLGKRAARPGAVKGRFTDYFDIAKLDAPPAKFGHDKLVADGFPMLCNDIVGDCAGGAGGLHYVQLSNAEAGIAIPVNDRAALANYAAITGYVQGEEIEGFDAAGNAIKNYDAPPNPTDQGTAVPDLLNYWYQTGLVDAAGRRHQLGAAVPLEPGNWEQLWYASWYADGVAIGIALDERWQNAFQQNKPWIAYKRPEVEGGHFILQAAFDNDDEIAPCATWGGIGLLSRSAYEQGNDEVYAILSKEKLKNGVDLEGRNWSQLIADLPMLRDIASEPESETEPGE